MQVTGAGHIPNDAGPDGLAGSWPSLDKAA